MSQSEKKNINQRLRQARMRKFLTVESAARIADVSATTYTRWEQGHQKPHLASLGRLCQAFEATPAQLGFGDVIGDEVGSVVEAPIPEASRMVGPTARRREEDDLRIWNRLRTILSANGVNQDRWLSMDVRPEERHAIVELSRPVSSRIKRDIASMFARDTGYSLTFREARDRQLTFDELYSDETSDPYIK